jgi:hypothetical protein
MLFADPYVGWNPATSTLTLGAKNLQLNVVKPKQKGLSNDDSLQLAKVLAKKLGTQVPS